VLFVVSALDGTMPALRQGIEALKNGRAHGPAAILVVDLEDVPDRELQQLVIDELRHLLVELRVRGGSTMPVFRDDDSNIRLLLRGLVSVRCSGGRVVRTI
jgi:translation elongation factor EF-Tu-like GTPase